MELSRAPRDDGVGDDSYRLWSWVGRLGDY